MEPISFMLEQMTRAAPVATALLFTGAVACVLLGVLASAVGLLLVRPERPRLRWLAAPPIASFGVFVAALVVLLDAARTEQIALTVGHEMARADTASSVGAALSASVNGLYVGAVLACFAVPAAGASALAWVRTQPPRVAFASLAALAVATLLGLVVAAPTVVYVGEVLAAVGAVADADPSTRMEHLDRSLGEAGAWLATARSAVLGISLIGGLAAMALAARAARAGQKVGPGGVGAGIAMFVLGLAAFAATRAQAYDAAHPIELGAIGLVSVDADLALPAADACEPPNPGPTLLASGGGAWRLDGREGSLAEHEAYLSQVARNWDILHPSGAPPALLLGAAPGVPMTELAPWLDAAHRAGIHHVDGLTRAAPYRWSTRTAGELEHPSLCVVRFELAPDATTSVRAHERWSELLEAAQGEHEPRFAP